MAEAMELGIDPEALEDFLKEIATSVAMGLVPGLGQAIDIYDTLWAAYDLYTSKEASQDEKEEAYFGMALAAVGWIPGPGDGIKKTLKTINKNPKKYAPLLLDAVRAALYQAGYKVDAYAFLMDSIDSARIGSIVANVRPSVVASSTYQRLPEFVQQGALAGLSMAEKSVPMVVGVVERKVLKWLKSSPKSTGKGTPAHSKKTEKEEETKPINDPQTQHGNDKVGQDGKSRLAQVATGTETAAEIVVSHISQSQEGIGEHVADYYCLHSLAAKDHLQHHDTGGRSSVKRSDFGKLTPLVTSFKARGGGIDAIWKTAGAKKYAITEYKTRETGLGAVAMGSLLVLESAQDADAKPAHRKKRSEYKQANKQAAKTGVPHDLSKPELKSTVPKMSHKWIKDRIAKVDGLNDAEKINLSNKNSYSRHVIQVVTSKGDGKAHKEELQASIAAKRPIDASKHTDHLAGIDNFENIFTEAPTKQSTAPQTQAPKNSGRNR